MDIVLIITYEAGLGLFLSALSSTSISERHSCVKIKLNILCIYRAQRWVQSSLDLEQKTVVSFFETTIRLVGGLLSAFELSQEEIFLQKAQQLTDKLMISCEENYSKLPVNHTPDTQQNLVGNSAGPYKIDCLHSSKV